MGQDGVLLGLVESVDLVDEKDRAQSGPAVNLRLGHLLPQVGHTGRHRRDPDQARLRLTGEEARQGGLAAARGTPQDDARQVPGARQLAEDVDDLPLADELVEGARPHARGQWSAWLIPGHGLEQLSLPGHALILNPSLRRDAAVVPGNRLDFPHIDCPHVHLLVLQLRAA